MRTIITALTAFAGCTVTRWYLDRTSRRDEEFCQGRVRLRSLWNEGACFGAPVPKRLLNIASSAAMKSSAGCSWPGVRIQPLRDCFWAAG